MSESQNNSHCGAPQTVPSFRIPFFSPDATTKTIEKIKLEATLEPVEQIEPLEIGPNYGYYHCRPLTPELQSELSDILAEENSPNNSQNFFDELNIRAKSDQAKMVGVRPPKNTFIICSHGTKRHILRWQDIPLVKGDDSKKAMHKGYWTPKVFADKLLHSSSMSKKLRSMNSCEYIIILACNTGNDIEPSLKVCFAEELSKLLNKPCYAPQGYLFYSEDSEPDVWSEMVVVKDEYGIAKWAPSGEKRGFKMFYPEAESKCILPPDRINLNSDYKRP